MCIAKGNDRHHTMRVEQRLRPPGASPLAINTLRNDHPEALNCADLRCVRYAPSQHQLHGDQPRRTIDH